jgi:hypothetical protein
MPIRIIIDSPEDLIFQKTCPHFIRERVKVWFEGKYHLDKRFSCGGFLYYISHGTLPLPVPKYWASEDSEKVTNMILLNNEHKKGHHFAWYLKELDLYLSQYGNGGEIVLSDLEDMQQFFKTTNFTYIKYIEPATEKDE